MRVVLCGALACLGALALGVGESRDEVPAHANQPEQPPKTVLVIHAGAGVLTEQEMKNEKVTRQDIEQALARALTAGHRVLQTKGKTSVDAVEAAIRALEDCGQFNAGRGAAFNSDGRVELDAAIMEGKMTGTGSGKRDPRKRAGAVTGIAHVKNPISAARAVMEMDGSRHVLLAGQGAEDYVLAEPIRAKYQLEKVSNLYFWSDRRLKQIRNAFEREQLKRRFDEKQSQAPIDGADQRLGTVGAVAVDGNGNLAAGTSTGGLTNKLPGRVGDTPLIGAGTFADDRACGVSCTGTGEVFIRHVVAHDVAARMLYGKADLAVAVRDTINSLPDETDGVGGLIALDRQGKHAYGMSPKSVGMYRGHVTEDGQVWVAIFVGDRLKKVTSDK